MRQGYREWLEKQEYSANTVSTQVSHTSRLKQAYGDLEEHFGRDGGVSIARSLGYTAEDGRRGAPNPSRLQIGGDLYKALASYRTALSLHLRFLADTDQAVASVPPELGVQPEPRERIGLERDLQKALRRDIAQIEPGLVVIDEGVERSVPSGFIDITARDAHGAAVAIELKAGTADRAAVGQVLSYMGDLAEEEGGEVRGMLIAHDFDAKARSAARMVPNLGLRTYAIRFVFENPLGASS